MSLFKKFLFALWAAVAWLYFGLFQQIDSAALIYMAPLFIVILSAAFMAIWKAKL